jgi:methylenetetrahydrofolate reductase (NADPH)
MPRVSDLLQREKSHALDNADGVTWSFEFFPPKTDAGVENLDSRLDRMRGMHPEFVDFTWGAGGSTSELTVDLCKMAQNKHKYVANMHLTCTNMERGKVEEALRVCKEHHIRNIVALRGDPPAGQAEWKATDTGFTCALDLIKYIREETGDHFCLSVSGYPECHPDQIPDYAAYLETGDISSEIQKHEMDYLKAKVDAGADVIITQMFYNAEKFLKWEKACRAAGIPDRVKILPGLLPIQNYGGFKRMTAFCKSFVSKELIDAVEAHKPADDLEGEEKKAAEDAFKEFGVAQMTEMCRELLAGGVRHLHFYTLNLDKSTTAVLRNLKLIPEDYSDDTAAEYAKACVTHPAFVDMDN